jgi:hypothetical protein
VIALIIGNIFLANKGHAQPPLPPRKEGCTPADVFPDMHRIFLDKERRRMSVFIERSAGCMDLRSIISVSLCEDNGDRSGKKDGRFFEMTVACEDPVRLEAHSTEDAKEWVERLKALVAYWKRRHRVE